jgi:hypothetical protein
MAVLAVGWIMVLLAALTKYALLTIRQKLTTVAFVMETGYQKALGLFGLILLTSLIIVVGLVAFIIPGLIFIYWFLLAPYIYIDQDVSIIEALKISKRLMKPRIIENLGLLSAGCLLSLPGLIPIIGLFYQFFFNATYYMVWAYRYDSRQKALKRGDIKAPLDRANWWAIFLAIAALTILLAGGLALGFEGKTRY